MKKWHIPFLIAVFAVVPLFSLRADEKTLTLPEFNRMRLIGGLGKPLGTVVNIEGVVLADSYRRQKADEGETLLEVEKVDGKAIAGEVILRLHAPSYVSLKMPKPGHHFKYIGFETGAFVGIPGEAFRTIPRVAGRDFQFDVYFEAIAER